jgi:hypothetical protein
MHLQSSINHSSQKLHWTEKSSIKLLIMNYISRTNISQPVHTQFSLMLNQGVCRIYLYGILDNLAKYILSTSYAVKNE